MSQRDVIVVGAGSAGCVLGWRLASEHGLRVTIVEPPSLSAPLVDSERPARWLKLLGSGDDWDLRTEPSGAMAGRTLSWPRGRGLGGSSRINAMIWFPPTESDLQMLVAASGNLWATDELRSAYQLICQAVKPESPRWLSDDARQFRKGVAGWGDATPMIYQRMNRNGRRWNPANLLDPIRRQSDGIEIVRTGVDRLLWEQDRAVGVRVGSGVSASDLVASAGVVLCSGTIATPTILMRSGIGPRDELAAQRIDVRCDQPNVGRHLQDHLVMPVIFGTKAKTAFSIDASPRDVARWQALGTGPVSSNIAECGGLFQNGSVQIHLTPTNYLTFPRPSADAAMTLGVNLTQPISRGSITLASWDPQRPPRIKANYLGEESDLVGTIAAVRLARSVASTTSLAHWIRGEILPGSKRQSDAAIAKSIARYAQTLYHPVGTCRLGEAAESVIDPHFRVRGTERLWIVDASVLPRLTLGNPNATVMTLATLAADSIRRQLAS